LATVGLAFSPAGRRVAAAGTSGVTVWEAASGRVLHKFRAHPLFELANYETHVAFSPDGRRLATATRGGAARGLVDGVEKAVTQPAEVKVWDAESGKELMRLARGGGGLAFSPDGTRIASGNGDGTVSVWDAASGKVLVILRGHARVVSGVAFSPDGRRIATAGTDHTVKVWDAPSGQEVLTLRGHGEPVVSVAFSPDGRYLASASALHFEPGQVKLWEAAPTER
jgi:WD40 repeat protein